MLQNLKELCISSTSTTFQDSFSEQVWETTYKDYKDYNIDDSLFRVASAIASVEASDELKQEWTIKFYDLLSGFKGVPGGRILSNAGTEWNGTTLANCFVSPQGAFDIDSLDGILNDLRNQATTLKSEGGWGFNFSHIRPRGAFIQGIGVETPGAVKYMELFDKSSEIITSGSGKTSKNKKAKGKIRKGAMMSILDVSHPDIMEFITAKQQPGRLTKFNMSVNCTDAFMGRVNRIREIDLLLSKTPPISRDWIELSAEREELDRWCLIFPDTTHPEYKRKWNGNVQLWINNGYPTKVYDTISTMKLWNLIMESTYNRAEPGVVFLDRANYYNPLNYAENIIATNPCLRGDTLVTTTMGEKTIKSMVEDFNTGIIADVYTYNTFKNTIEIETITNAILTKHNAEIIELEFDCGNILRVTPDHKIYTQNRGYVEASLLTEEDDIIIKPLTL